MPYDEQYASAPAQTGVVWFVGRVSTSHFSDAGHFPFICAHDTESAMSNPNLEENVLLTMTETCQSNGRSRATRSSSTRDRPHAHHLPSLPFLPLSSHFPYPTRSPLPYFLPRATFSSFYWLVSCSLSGDGVYPDCGGPARVAEARDAGRGRTLVRPPPLDGEASYNRRQPQGRRTRRQRW